MVLSCEYLAILHGPLHPVYIDDDVHIHKSYREALDEQWIGSKIDHRYSQQ